MMRRVKRYFVFSVRVLDKGKTLQVERLHVLMTKKQMDLMADDLLKRYGTAMNTIAFNYEEYAGFWRLLQIALVEFKNECIMY